MKEHGLYKYVYNNEIIYIGKSNVNIANRIDNHKKEAKFQPYLSSAQIYICNLPNSTETDILEKILINHYKPILNGTDNKPGISGLISFIEPNWKLYSPNIQKTKKEEYYAIISKQYADKWIMKNQLFIETYDYLIKKINDGEYSCRNSSLSNDSTISIDVTDLYINNRFQKTAVIDAEYSYDRCLDLIGYITYFESEQGTKKAFYVNPAPDLMISKEDINKVYATIDKYALISQSKCKAFDANVQKNCAS